MTDQITSQEQSIQPTSMEQFVAYASTRKGIAVVSWCVGLGIILLLSATISHLNTTFEMAVMVASTFIMAICVQITIFARYVDREKFPISAFFNIGMTFFFSFSSIGILSMDLAFTLNHKYHNDLKEQEKHDTLKKILWNLIYWGSLLFGTVLSKFFSKYWQSGHFSICGRVKHSFKQLLILMVGGGIVLGILGFSIYTKFGFQGLNGVKAALLIMTNVYSMLQLVVLLAYGLFNLPVYLWKCADNKHSLFEELQNAENIRSEYRTAMTDFQMFVIECKNLINQHRNGYNTLFMDILEDELPKQDLEGQSIVSSSSFMMEMKKGQDVTEDFLANVRYQLKVSFFLYKRKKAKWVSLFEKVDRLVQKPLDWDRIRERVNQDKKDKIKDNDKNISLDDLILRPIPNNQRKIWLSRVGTIISILFSLLVLSTEGLMIYNPEYTLMYLTVGCFNYMMILGEMAVGKDIDSFGTSYCDFYSSMIRVPLFGQYFNKLMCFFILLFGGIFGLMSLFKYQNKAMAAFKNYSKKVEDQVNKIQKKQDKAEKKKSLLEEENGKSKGDKLEEYKEVGQSELEIIKQILRGERAILAEYDIIKRKEDRSKLTKIDSRYDIEMQSKTKKASADNLDTVQSKNRLNVSAGGKKLQKQSTKNLQDEKNQPLLGTQKTKRGGILNSDSDSISDISNISNNKLATQGRGGISSIRASNRFQAAPTQKKIQFGAFRKAKLDDEDEIQQEPEPIRKQQNRKNNEPIQQSKQNVLDKSDDQKKTNQKKNRKISISSASDDDTSKKSSDSETEIKGKPLLKKPNNAIAARIGKGSQDVGDFKSRLQMKRNQAKTLQEEKTSKSKKKKLDLYKEGYLLKRKGQRFRKAWTKRYAVLEDSKLNFYDNEDKNQLIKSLDMSKIKSIAFHYDENAPVQSKNINKKDKEESRFDLYHQTKNKKYKFKVEDDNVWDSQAWVEILKQVAKKFNDDYQST
eukprot:403332633